MTRGRAIPYSGDELAWLEANCVLPEPELAERFAETFNRAISQDNLRAACQRRGWLTGRTGCFEKGSVPPNKGRKGWHPPGCEKGWFRKGERSINYKGPGHEYIDTKDGYVWLVVDGPSPYPSSTATSCHPVMKHRHLWEQAHGPIPPKHVLRCKDGNKQNSDPSNWWLIPMAIQPMLNRWSPVTFDECSIELKETLINRALLIYRSRLAREASGQLTAQERYRMRKRTAAANEEAEAA